MCSIIGYKFKPKPQECIDYFLRNKVNGQLLDPCFQIYEDRPIFGCQQLPWEVFQDNDPYWQNDSKNNKKVIYAFTRLQPIATTSTTKKHRLQHRRHVRRTAGCGTWCGQNKFQEIKKAGQVIGYQASFTFTIRNNDTFNKGKWILHEFSMSTDDTDWVFCKITVDCIPLIQGNNYDGRNMPVVDGYQGQCEVSEYPAMIQQNQHPNILQETMEQHQQVGGDEKTPDIPTDGGDEKTPDIPTGDALDEYLNELERLLLLEN